MRSIVAIFTLSLAACSSAPDAKQTKQPVPEAGGPATSSSKHPLAKYIEFGGFRISEAGAGKLNLGGELMLGPGDKTSRPLPEKA